MKCHKIRGLILISIGICFYGCPKADRTPVPDAAGPIIKTPTLSGTGLFIGLATFNETVSTIPMTEDTTKINSTIWKMDNTGKSSTALCYAIEKGIKLLKDLNATQSIDQSFIITFTDGADNYSSALFLKDGEQVYQPNVVNHTINALKTNSISGQYISQQIKCYTIGLASKDLNSTDLKNLAVNGSYNPANSGHLDETFQAVANSLITTSKNIAFTTNLNLYQKSAPKNYSITITGQD